MPLAATPSLREELQKRYTANRYAANPFTAQTQDNIGAAMNSTFANRNGMPPSSGTHGEINAAANYPAAPAASTPGAAPGAAPANPLATPAVDLSAGPGNIFATPGTTPASVSAAAGLMNAQQQAQLANYQTRMRDRLVNLDPTNQAPGDLAQSMKIAEDQFNIAFGGPNPGVSGVGGPSSASGLPKGVPVSTFAPTGTGTAALAAGGAPVTGYGGTQVTGIAAPGNPFSTPATPSATSGGFVPGAGYSGMGGTSAGAAAAPARPTSLPVWQQNQMPGNRFTLTQNPNTVPGAPGYIPPAAPPPNPAVSGNPISQGVQYSAGRTPFQQASKAVQTGGVMTYPNAAAVEEHFPSEKYDYSMTPGPGGAVAVKSVSPRAPRQPVPEVPNPLVLKQYEDLSAERKEKVMPAIATRNAYAAIKPLLTADKMITGTAANTELQIRKIASRLGGGDDPKISGTELVRSQLAIPLFSTIKNLGSGTSITDADREFVADVVGQNIKLDLKTIQQLVEIGERATDAIVSDYEDRLNSTFPEATDNAQYKQARTSLGTGKKKLPAGVTPELLNAMTPEQRALFK